MSWHRFLLALAVLAGSVSGSSSLEAAASSQPPISWGSLVFLFFGSLFGLALVLGLQAALINAKALRWGWPFFLYGAVFCAVSGLAALLVAFRGPGAAPYSFLFLVLGVGMLCGLGLVRLLFKGKFLNAASGPSA